MHNNQINPPKKNKSDSFYIIAKAGISLIPIVGGALCELFDLIIHPPAEIKRDEWIKVITTQLNQLNGKNIPHLEFDLEKIKILNSNGITSITDHGNLDCSINFTDEIIPSNLIISGFPTDPVYKLIEPSNNVATKFIRIKFETPCPSIITLRLN